LWEQECPNKVGIRIALTNVGHKASALGLNALLHGTETPNYHLDTIAVVAKAMETVDCKNMAHWILALSMGMELRMEVLEWLGVSSCLPLLLQLHLLLCLMMMPLL
jgi:hypothetical protein